MTRDLILGFIIGGLGGCVFVGALVVWLTARQKNRKRGL